MYNVLQVTQVLTLQQYLHCHLVYVKGSRSASTRRITSFPANRVRVFNTTFSNISVTLRQSVLLVEKPVFDVYLS
jgi:hypothetical protein